MNEKAQKPSVYIESSVISYLTSKENRDLIVALLPASDEISFLAKEYFRRMQIPDHAMYDSLHLACAVLNGIDIIVSWNFKHIANPTIRHILRTINDKLGYETPEITTPEELMEGDL